MSAFKRTSASLSRTLETSLTEVAARSEDSATSRWVFRHIPGTRQFALFGSSAISNAKVSVHCTLPTPASGVKRRRIRVQKISEPILKSTTKLPFTCQLSNLSRGFPLVLTLRCEARAEQLVISGARFTRGTEELRQGPEATREHLAYNGPYITQTHLSDLVIGSQPLSSPLNETLHAEAVFFNSTSCFDNSAHNWYGHSPVHTVQPDVADAIAQFAASFGIDDSLAAYVAEKAELVERAEKSAWRQLLQDAVLS